MKKLRFQVNGFYQDIAEYLKIKAFHYLSILKVQISKFKFIVLNTHFDDCRINEFFQ